MFRNVVGQLKSYPTLEHTSSLFEVDYKSYHAEYLGDDGEVIWVDLSDRRSSLNL